MNSREREFEIFREFFNYNFIDDTSNYSFSQNLEHQRCVWYKMTVYLAGLKCLQRLQDDLISFSKTGRTLLG